MTHGVGTGVMGILVDAAGEIQGHTWSPPTNGDPSSTNDDERNDWVYNLNGRSEAPAGTGGRELRLGRVAPCRPTGASLQGTAARHGGPIAVSSTRELDPLDRPAARHPALWPALAGSRVEPGAGTELDPLEGAFQLTVRGESR